MGKLDRYIIVDQRGRKIGKGEIRVDYDNNKKAHINVTNGNNKFAFIYPIIPPTGRGVDGQNEWDWERQINQQKDTLTDDVENNMEKDKNGNVVLEPRALAKATARFLNKDFWEMTSHTGRRL
ncbi:hypothetical protein QBC41DRAFT_227884 [Cercophora samala]|uniref:Uncharacterized protein n=1 Tax=Cercophora samala TaxID=330535 RepID=A0AA40D8Y1_9PEZI|nr:hypothetical protein QBC41DRAFT_227884 [Cercophora samala]